jgi:hypothetical protein
MVPLNRSPLHFLLLGALLLSGCKDSKITAYRVPKESAPAPATAATTSPPVASPGHIASTNDLPPAARGGPGATPPPEGSLPPGHPPLGDMTSTPAAAAGASFVGTPAGSALAWTAPAPWTPRKVSAMRRGSYTIGGPEGEGDLAVINLSGDAGGDLANVNRWRAQLQLPPVTDLGGAAEIVEENGLRMLVFDAANGGRRILGAIVPRPGETWFFKLTGPDALVAREKPVFREFLKTVKTP